MKCCKMLEHRQLIAILAQKIFFQNLDFFNISDDDDREREGNRGEKPDWMHFSKDWLLWACVRVCEWIVFDLLNECALVRRMPNVPLMLIQTTTLLTPLNLWSYTKSFHTHTAFMCDSSHVNMWTLIVFQFIAWHWKAKMKIK